MRMVEAPLLHSCPRCGLPVQEGGSPFDLAWHSCEWVEEIKARETVVEGEVTLASAQQAVIKAILARLDEADFAEAMQLLRQLDEMGRPCDAGGEDEGGVGDIDIEQWLRKAEPNELAEQ